MTGSAGLTSIADPAEINLCLPEGGDVGDVLAAVRVGFELEAAVTAVRTLERDLAAAHAAGAAEARKVFAVVGKASGGEYWLQVKTGAERQGQKLGVEVLWLGTPAETDVAKQIEEELTYPGQIRVTVVRESRATETAR